MHVGNARPQRFAAVAEVLRDRLRRALEVAALEPRHLDVVRDELRSRREDPSDLLDHRFRRGRVEVVDDALPHHDRRPAAIEAGIDERFDEAALGEVDRYGGATYRRRVAGEYVVLERERGGEVDLEELGVDVHPVRPCIEAGPEQEHLGMFAGVGRDEGRHCVVDVARTQPDHVLQRLVGARRGDRTFVDDQAGERVVDQPLPLRQLSCEHAARGDQRRAATRPTLGVRVPFIAHSD